MRRVLPFAIAGLLAAPTALASADAEMGIAVTGEGRLWDQDAAGRSSGFGAGVYQHTHFGRMVGTDVGMLFSWGNDAHDHSRVDLGFLMPGIALRIPTDGDLQPYFSTGFVMTCSFFSGPSDVGGVLPFVYAGNRSAMGLEWRTDKDQSWFFELATTVRARFTVEKDDKPTMASHPDFARDTRVVHELSLAIGTAFFLK